MMIEKGLIKERKVDLTVEKSVTDKSLEEDSKMGIIVLW